MKKINLLGYLSMAFVFAFSSCSNEDSSILEDLNSKNDESTVEIYNETAFGYHNWDGHESELNTSTTCFEDDGFNRWGWTIGPFIERQLLHLYAGAGQCDLDKGTRVGWAVARYNHISRSGYIHFQTYTPYKILETHAYLGSAMYPTDNKGNPTVAPGQYPFKSSHSGGVDKHTYFLSDMPDDGSGFYFIAHAVVTK